MQKIILCACVLSMFFLGSCKKELKNDEVNITIGGLLSLTGNWSSLGITSEAAMKIAAEDINQYMKDRNSPYRFSVSTFDTKLDTVLALQWMKEAHHKGIRYVVGPQSSAELASVLNYANNNDMLVVSQGSTASSLAVANDAVFRFCPGDAVEGRAIAETMYASGKRAMISMSRDDAGNKGLQQAVGATFSSMGGIVFPTQPYSTTATSFSSLLATVKTKLQEYISIYGSNNVAIYLASFDECRELFLEAKNDPVFSSVKWYGGDGVAVSSVLAADMQAAAFASATSFIAPAFGLPLQAHPALASITATIKSKTGIDPDAYTFAAYDAMWVIARTIAGLPAGSDPVKTRKAFFTESNLFFGITGAMQLNAAGDRNSGSFDYHGLVLENGRYVWKVVGKSL
jgi:branched-chain amino acid transport system substrate-binding protein